jgi:hypothetical protein
MDWKKIYLEIQSRGCHEDFPQDLIDALREYNCQHLAKHHGPHRHRFGDGVWVTGSELPMDKPAVDDDPPTRLSGTMEPERSECDGSCHDPVNYNFYHIDRGWEFCPWCGKPLDKKEEKP